MTFEELYKTFPSGCTEEYKIRKAFEAGQKDNSKVIEELEKKIKKIRDYLAYKIPRELMNEATNKIWNMV